MEGNQGGGNRDKKGARPALFPRVGWRALEDRDNDVVREMGERQGLFFVFFSP